jgi:hypothetical protein
MDGAGLNITVMSYRNHIDIGFLADADLVPDIWEVAAQVQPAFDELKQLAGIVDPTIVKDPAPVTDTSRESTVDLRAGATPAKKAPRRKGPRPMTNPSRSGPRKRSGS